MVPDIIAFQSAMTSDWSSSIVFKLPARKITGIDNKNEKREDASRVKPSNNPAVIVIPEREVPGIRARA